MIDILFFIVFIVISFRLFRGFGNEEKIFVEFNQPLTLRLIALLFPVGPVVFMTLTMILGWLPTVVLAYACYIPAMILSKKGRKGRGHPSKS